MKFKPYQYQLDCVQFLQDHPRSALFLEMGLGKSVVVLSHIRDLILNSCEIQTVLIVAPLRVATVTWPAEIEKWDHTQELSYHVLHGKGRRAGIPHVNIVITNYETLPWLAKNTHISRRFDYVVFDESTYLKNYSSKRWKYAFSMFGACTRLTLLTGTPIPNGLMDMWAQMFLLDQGARLGRTITSYRQTYFRQGGYMNYQYIPFKNATELVTDKIKDMAKTLKAKDYLQMPRLIFNDIPVALPPGAVKIYKEMEKKFFVDLKGAEIIAFNAASLSNKLRQCVQGFMYDDQMKAHQIHRAKVDALRELMDSYPAEHFLIGINFVQEIEQLRQEFPSSAAVYGKTGTKESAEAIKAWNEGKLRTLFAHPASLSHGLNLQTGGRMVVWMGPTWNLEHFHQFNARLHRQGQTKPVVVHTLVAKKTVDEHVSAALKQKDMTQEKLLQRLIKYERSGN